MSEELALDDSSTGRISGEIEAGFTVWTAGWGLPWASLMGCSRLELELLWLSRETKSS
jgi:hypothetical protein